MIKCLSCCFKLSDGCHGVLPFTVAASNINGWQHNGIFHSVILGNVYDGIIHI